jgi:hypothetical protein
MLLWSKNYPLNCDSGVEYFGTAGKMFLSKRGKMLIYDEQNRLVEEKRAVKDDPMVHLNDFVDAIRTGRRPNADILEGFRSVALIHLANIAVRTGRSLEFDPRSEQIVNDESANGLLSRQYRDGGHWAKPTGA